MAGSHVRAGHKKFSASKKSEKGGLKLLKQYEIKYIEYSEQNIPVSIQLVLF